MKRFLSILTIITAILTFSSCNKSVLTYYRYDVSEKIHDSNTSTTNIQAIDDALSTRLSQYTNLTDNSAKNEWNSFVSSVDDSKVIFGTDEEYVTVSFVKVKVYEKGDFETESEVVATIGKKTWKKSGVIEE